MEVTWSLQQPVSAALSLFANHPSIKDLRSHSQVTRRLSSVYDICSLLFIFDCRLTDVSWLTPVYLLPACLCDALCLLFPAFIFIRQNSLIRLLTTCHVACQRVFLFLFGSSLAASYSGFFFFFFFSQLHVWVRLWSTHSAHERSLKSLMLMCVCIPHYSPCGSIYRAVMIASSGRWE